MFQDYEKYTIEGKTVEIQYIDYIEPLVKEKICFIIREFTKESELAAKFSKIKYTLGETSHDKLLMSHYDTLMYVVPDETRRGLNVIYIPNCSKILSNNSSKIKYMLLHELTHIWYYRTYAIAKTIRDSRSRLIDLMNIKSIYSKNKDKENIYDIRGTFGAFLGYLLSEGIAEYSSKIKYENALLDESTFNKLYNNAVYYASHVKLKLLKYNEFPENRKKLLHKLVFWMTKDDHFTGLVKNIKEAVEDAAYYIGYHMVQTILYIDKTLTMENVCEMNHFSFINKYEACMNLLGKQPIVSITTGKGILDYQQILADLNRLHTIVTEQNKK